MGVANLAASVRDQLPDWRIAGSALIVALVTFVLGAVIFQRLQRGFTDLT